MAPEDRTIPGGDALLRALESAGSAPGSGPSGDPGQTSGPAAPDLGKLLEAMMAQSSQETSGPEAAEEPAADNTGDPRLTAILAALPQLIDAMSGKSDLVKAEKVNLVRAIKPYLPGERAASVDRAIRLANMTKAAKNALRLLGR